MRPSHFVGIIFGDDGHAARRRDEDFRAWHRQPDAPPLPDVPRREVQRFAVVRRLAKSAALLGVFGREG